MRPPWDIASDAVKSQYHGQIELVSVALEADADADSAFGTIHAAARVVRSFRGGTELLGRPIQVAISCHIAGRQPPPGPSYDTSDAFQPGRCLEIFFTNDGAGGFTALGEPLYFVDAPTDTPCMVYAAADARDPDATKPRPIEARGSAWASRGRLLIGVALSVSALTFFIYVLRSLFER